MSWLLDRCVRLGGGLQKDKIKQDFLQPVEMSGSAFLSVQLPRAVNTQALSSAGLLRMVNKAADAVNKMTIKMNESDAVSAGEEEEEVRMEAEES